MTSEEYTKRLRSEMKKSGTHQFTNEYIEECCSYANTLFSRNLPVLFNGEHIYSLLRLYAVDEQSYHEFYIPKRGGGTRLVVSPSRPLKQRQRWILKNILTQLPISPYAQGFVANHSIVTNASLHKNFKYTFCADIKNFFHR